VQLGGDKYILMHICGKEHPTSKLSNSDPHTQLY